MNRAIFQVPVTHSVLNGHYDHMTPLSCQWLVCSIVSIKATSELARPHGGH
jgi:hypothetical protein